jgi:hypothetical protein
MESSVQAWNNIRNAVHGQVGITYEKQENLIFCRGSGRKARYGTIERLDQGHLYPLGEHRDKHVTGGAQTSALLHRRRPLYLKSYPDSL